MFSIVESLVTHQPKSSDSGESLTHQIATKLPLLQKRFQRSLDHTQYFPDLREHDLWKRLYNYRSALAHGEECGFSIRVSACEMPCWGLSDREEEPVLAPLTVRKADSPSFRFRLNQDRDNSAQTTDVALAARTLATRDSEKMQVYTPSQSSWRDLWLSFFWRARLIRRATLSVRRAAAPPSPGCAPRSG